MIDYLQGYYLERPRELIALGRGLVGAASALVIAGVLGNVAVSAQAAIQRMANPQVAAATVAQLYPDWWTWWVPESLPGYLPALVLASVGVWCALTGRRWSRQFHSRPGGIRTTLPLQARSAAPAVSKALTMRWRGGSGAANASERPFRYLADL